MGFQWGCLALARASYRWRGGFEFFDNFDIRPLRGGAGRGSTRSSCYELGVPFFPRARSELGSSPWRCGCNVTAYAQGRAHTPALFHIKA